MGNGKYSPGVVLGTVVALVTLAVALVTAISFGSGVNDKNTPLITMVLGLIATAVPSVIALLKVGSVQHDIRNGVLREKVRQGIAQALEETAVRTTNGGDDTHPLILGGPTLIDSFAQLLEEKLREQDTRKDNGNG